MAKNSLTIKWYLSRLKSMNVIEIFWRLKQTLIKKSELLKYNKPNNIYSIKYGKFNSININKLNLYTNKDFLSTNYEPELIGDFVYADYKNKWSCGFNTNNNWSNIPSYKLNYKGRDDIGDARINWQLNRHHQFVLLAKNYYLTNNKNFMYELTSLFDSWNKENPFLYGISWASPMEVAIRCINWVYCYYFIYKTDINNSILEKLEMGIINMSNYVYKHISKYSSGNNHKVVELGCVLLTAILTNNTILTNKVFSLLSRELEQQNYKDGVNKEQSLHYEAFFLETISLSAKLLKDSNYDISPWKETILYMSKYISDCLDSSNLAIEFGDNDEGYIIRLGKETNYYKYVVNLSNKLFDIPNSLEYSSETLQILLGQKEFNQNYHFNKISLYKDGGITLIRNNNHLIGIDHGTLGYGSIAAHGHADALSFQIILDGNYFLIDPGTYIYHINRIKRDYYRSTINHNTVCINNMNQSEILGPFLWGKKANTELISFNNNDDKLYLSTKHNGYGEDVIRNFIYSSDTLVINDDIGNKEGIANLSFGPNCSLTLNNNTIKVVLNNKTYIIYIKGNIIKIEKKNKTCSLHYGTELNIQAMEITFKNQLTTTINLKDSNE